MIPSEARNSHLQLFGITYQKEIAKVTYGIIKKKDGSTYVSPIFGKLKLITIWKAGL